MDYKRKITATLTHEDVQKAVADYATKNLFEDREFDPSTVVITSEDMDESMTVTATVRIEN